MATKYTKNAQGYYTTKVWDGTYQDGKKHYKYLRSSKSSKDLEEKVRKYRNKVDDGESTSSNDITVAEYAENWMDFKKPSIRLNTINKYQRTIDTKISKIGNVKLVDLTYTHWNIMTFEEKKSVVFEIRKVYIQMIKQAVKEHYLPKSALENLYPINPKKTKKRSKRRALNESESNATMSCELAPREKAFLWILYGCGLRRGEALALTVDDIKNGKIEVNQVLVFDGENPIIEKDLAKTETSLRQVPMPKFLDDYLKEYKKTVKKYLFTNQNGGLITKTNYRRMWGHIKDALELKLGEPTELTAHYYRHNYITLLCYQVPKISINTVALLSGDSVKTCLDIYNHIQQEKEDATSAINDAFK